MDPLFDGRRFAAIAAKAKTISAAPRPAPPPAPRPIAPPTRAETIAQFAAIVDAIRAAHPEMTRQQAQQAVARANPALHARWLVAMSPRSNVTEQELLDASREALARIARARKQ